MIFVTTGTQEPFDRLLLLVDRLGHLYNGEIVIQAKTNLILKSKNIKLFDFISPSEFTNYFNKSLLIISHAGMGTVLSALNSKKPILIVPRKIKLGEHRNDHQWFTAKKLNELKYAFVAFEEEDFITLFKLLINEIDTLKPLFEIGKHASKTLIQSIEEFIENE